MTTVIVPAELDPETALPAAVLPVRDRRHVVALFSVLRAAAAGRRPSGRWPSWSCLLVAAAVAEGWAVSIPDHEGLQGMWGAPFEPGYRVLDGIRAALSSNASDLSADAPDRAVGILRRWAGQRLGRRNVRRPTHPSWTSSGRCWDRPSATWATPSAGSMAASFAGLPAMVVAALVAHLSRPGPRHQRAHQRRGPRPAGPLETMTTVGAVIRMARQEHGRLPRRAAGRHPVDAGGLTCLRQHQAGRRGADAAGVDRAGRARLPDRRQRHRRAGRRLFGRRRQGHLPSRRVQRTHGACTRCPPRWRCAGSPTGSPADR